MHHDRTAEEHWEEEGPRGLAWRNSLPAWDSRTHHNLEEAVGPEGDERMAQGCHNLAAGREAVVGREVEGHNYPGAVHSFLEEGHSFLEEDHIDLEEGQEEERHSFHSRNPEPVLGQAGSRGHHLGVERRRSGLDRDIQTCHDVIKLFAALDLEFVVFYVMSRELSRQFEVVCDRSRRDRN